MLNQLIRQEAMEAYTERWLGECSATWSIPPLPLALTGFTALSFLAAILNFGFYTRQVPLQAVVRHWYAEVEVTASQAADLRVGENLPLKIQTGNLSRKHYNARITSIASMPRQSRYRVEFQIPSTLRSAEGDRILVLVPSERRRLYQWMFLCSPN